MICDTDWDSLVVNTADKVQSLVFLFFQGAVSDVRMAFYERGDLPVRFPLGSIPAHIRCGLQHLRQSPGRLGGIRGYDDCFASPFC